MMLRLIPTCAVMAFLIGCPTPVSVVEPDKDVKEERPARESRPRTLTFEGHPVAVPRQFEPGCTALGDTEEIIGTVEALEFGKGKRGVIIDDGNVKWVVSYDADGIFEDFDRESVLATGTRCEKQGAAIKAHHFEVRSLRVIARQ